jgi:hypothetical protein
MDTFTAIGGHEFLCKRQLAWAAIAVRITQLGIGGRQIGCHANSVDCGCGESRKQNRSGGSVS